MIPARSPLPPATDATGKPLNVNISRLTFAFGSADLMDDVADEQDYLTQVFPHGQVFTGANDAFTYAIPRDPRTDRSLARAVVYRSGHGRDGCNIRCRETMEPPHNCGYHPQWKLPTMFQLCGEECKCGLCACLESYGDLGYYG